MKGKMPVSKAKTAYGLLGEIARLIVEEPKRYNQGTWLVTRNDVSNHPNMPACGTIGCVAGWVTTLKGTPNCDFVEVSIQAESILNLDDPQSTELFSGRAARGIPQTVKHARSGAAHIRRFMRKYSTQLKKTKV